MVGGSGTSATGTTYSEMMAVSKFNLCALIRILVSVVAVMLCKFVVGVVL